MHIINSLEIGGAQRLLSDILPLLAKDNQVTLLVNKEVDNDFTQKVKDAEVKVITTGCHSLYNPKNIWRIARLARGYDVVHVHLFPMVYWAAFASLLMPMRLIYTEHNTTNRRREKWYLRPIEQFVYKRYQKVISISQQTQDALTEWLKTKKNDPRFVVINNGINISAFQNLVFNKIYPHTMIMVSRFAAQKDQGTVIKAMRLLPEDVHVIFVGDGINFDMCKDLAQSLGVEERTHFVGAQADVASWIAKADIGVQSSIWEGFGLTAVEMMVAGLPVVSSDVDGLKQVVEGGGILFEVGNSEDLARQITLLLNDNHYYHEVAKRCKDRAEHYDISKMAKQYVQLYRDLYNG